MEAVSWASSAPVKTPEQRLVLLLLAMRSCFDHRAVLSDDALPEQASMPPDQFMDAVHELVKMGLLNIEERNPFRMVVRLMVAA